jgi:DNA topoisomerase-1
MRALTPEETPATKTHTTRQLVEVVKTVARELGNTPAVCRKCYIHPALIQSFQRGEFHGRLGALADHPSTIRGLDADERLTLAFLTEAAERSRAVA